MTYGFCFYVILLTEGYNLISILVANNHAIHIAISHTLQQVPSLPIDRDSLLFQRRNLGDEVQSTLTLLLLQFKGDVADGTLGDALHEVGGEAGNLVAHSL